jgi:3-isopropylmalate/(R)-2-methylmalate dehydratase large subunit
MSTKNQTAVEKIISHNIKREVHAGEFVEAAVDYAMANDVTAALTIEVMQSKMKVERVYAPEKIVIIFDHHIPVDSVNTAEVLKKIRHFCTSQGVTFYENEGICHQIMLEKHVRPGDIVAGADSHTCSYGALGALSTGVGSTDLAAVFATGRMWMKVPETSRIIINGTLPHGVFAKDIILKVIGDATAEGFTYKVMEFSGNTVQNMELSDRITMCNMAVEAGAKASFVEPDERVREFLHSRLSASEKDDIKIFKSDEAALFSDIITINANEMEPMVAAPYTVDNVKPLKEVQGTRIDQVFLGSCTNGRIEDLRVAASILKGRKLAHGVRMLVVPASVSVYKQALKEGLISTFLDIGALVNHPGCSNCWGASQGILGKEENQVSTANRNFKGRSGDPTSGTFLVSPATAAATAVTGKITDPRNFIEKS